MKRCQIMVYGGKYHWIDVTQHDEPDVSWFIFITASLKKEPGKKVDFLEPIDDKIASLRESQKNLPDHMKIRYSKFEIAYQDDLVKVVRDFRAIINHVNSRGYTISCNVTAGIFEFQIGLYLAAQIESVHVDNVFYYNKQTYQKNLLFKSVNMTRRGTELLRVFHAYSIEQTTEKDPKLTLSQLRELLAKCNLNIEISSLSRLVSEMIKDGYLEEERRGRERILSITSHGRIFWPIEKQIEDVASRLKD